MLDCSSGMADNQQWTFDSSGRIALSSTAAANSKTSASGSPLCVTIGPGKDPTHGFPLAQVEACAGDASQQLKHVDDASSTVKNAALDLCLDVSNHDKDDGAPVGFYHCTPGSENEFWTVQDTPTHNVQLVVKETGKCLTAC